MRPRPGGGPALLAALFALATGAAAQPRNATAAAPSSKHPSRAICSDDGDPCTRDRCDAGGVCTHQRVESFPAITCDVDALRARLVGFDLPRGAHELDGRLAELRFRVSTAEASSLVGDLRRAKRRLQTATGTSSRFARHAARLEARHVIPSPSAGMLLDGARAVSQRIAELSDALVAPSR